MCLVAIILISQNKKIVIQCSIMTACCVVATKIIIIIALIVMMQSLSSLMRLVMLWTRLSVHIILYAAKTHCVIPLHVTIMVPNMCLYSIRVRLHQVSACYLLLPMEVLHWMRK